MHLQMLHKALHIPENRRPLAVRLAPTARAAAADTRHFICCPSTDWQPSPPGAFRTAEETAEAADFTFPSGATAPGVVYECFQVHVALGEEAPAVSDWMTLLVLEQTASGGRSKGSAGTGVGCVRQRQGLDLHPQQRFQMHWDGILGFSYLRHR